MTAKSDVSATLRWALMSALGHKRTFCDAGRCPLYPQKRTCAVNSAMSAKCQKQTLTLRESAPCVPGGLYLWARLPRKHRLISCFVGAFDHLDHCPNCSGLFEATVTR